MPALIALICYDPPTSILLLNASSRALPSVTALPASISADTKARALRHLKPWVPGARVSRKQCTRLSHILEECTSAFPESRLRLPSIIRMSAASPKAGSSHISEAVLSDVQWWRNMLTSSTRHLSTSVSKLEPRAPPTKSTNEDEGIFVDAATSWGVGLVINGYWMSWRFRDEWQLAERNNNVAETIAFELAIHYLIAQGTSDARVLIHCDSISVITAFNSGRSPNEEQARAVERIYGLRDVHHLDVQMQHVAGKKNPADAPSRGVLLPAPRLPGSLAIPPSLSPFVESV